MAQETTGSNGAAAADVEMVEANELRRRSKAGDRARLDGEGAVPAEEEEAAVSVERAFADQRVPSWREQLTVRAFVVGFILSILFSVIVMKLNLTTGIIPSLNVSASLLAFFLVRLWTSAIERMGLLKQPFTRQENTVIQTFVVSAYGIAFSGKTPN
jgi:hypothetical protein